MLLVDEDPTATDEAVIGRITYGRLSLLWAKKFFHNMYYFCKQEKSLKTK